MLPQPDGTLLHQEALMPPPIAEIGDESDAPWSGSGNGTLLSVLKGIWEKIAGVLTVRHGVTDSTGAVIYPDSYAISGVTRDASGNLLTTTITDGTNSWVQTITRDSNGNLATMSKWVRQ